MLWANALRSARNPLPAAGNPLRRTWNAVLRNWNEAARGVDVDWGSLRVSPVNCWRHNVSIGRAFTASGEESPALVKESRMISRIHRSFLLTAVMVGTAVLSPGWAAQPGRESRQADGPVTKGPQTLPECCAAMKKMKDEAMMDQKKSDNRLNALLASMNEASGPGKVDAMAAVINELAKQRADSREHMMHMDAAMKEHMMQHIMAAAPADMAEKMKKCMEACPMMGGPAGKGQ